MAQKKTTDTQHDDPMVVHAPRLETIEITITGRAPYVSNRFGAKAKENMMHDQMAGGTTSSKKTRSPKDFESSYRDSLYQSTEGWYGMNAAAFRNAAIDACRTVGYKMTHAKLAIFVEPDGWDADMTPLTRITGEPEMLITPVTNANKSTDLRARAIFKKWSATVTVSFDADMFTRKDVVNLFHRMGLQVGVGGGRPYSKMSAGMGWGRFDINPVVKILHPAPEAVA